MSRSKSRTQAAKAARARGARARGARARAARGDSIAAAASPGPPGGAALPAVSDVVVLDIGSQGTSPANPDDGVLRGRAAWRGAAGFAAAAVLLVQLVWRTSYLAQGYFTQDDFLMQYLGGTRPMGLPYLFRDYSGHIFPGGFLIAYAEAHLAPLSWPAAYIPVVLAQLAAGALMWLVLSRLLGARWERVPLLAVFCLCPLSLWSTQWWAVAIQFLPVELCALGAVLVYLRFRQDGDPRGVAYTLLLTGGGLLFQERGMLIPLVVFAVAVVVEPRDTTWGRLKATARSQPRLWLGEAAVVGAYLLLHFWLAPVQNSGSRGVKESLDLVTNFAFKNLLPGAVGGPWTGKVVPGVTVIPPDWVIVISCGLVAVLVAYTLRYGGSAARASWLVLLAYAVVDGALVFAGRAQFGSFSGLTSRYAADVMPLLAIALAGAVRDVRPPRRVTMLLVTRRGRDRRPLVFVVVGVVYAASAGPTTHLIAPYLFNTPAESYVDTLRHDLLQQPSVVLYDSTVPDSVMISWFGSDDRVSTVLGVAPGHPQFDVPSELMRIVDSEGHLRPIELAKPVAGYPGPGKDCGYNVTLSSTLVYLRGSAPFAKNVLRLGYYTNVDDTAVVTAGSETIQIPVHPGLHEVDSVVDTSFASFSIRLSSTAGTMCLVSVQAGTPRPVGP